MKNTITARRAALIALALLLAAALLAGCGAGESPAPQTTAAAYDAAPAAGEANYYRFDADDGTVYEDAITAVTDGGGQGGTPTLTLPQDDRKVILTAYLTIESLEYDDTCARLQQAALDAGGYISHTNVSGGEAGGRRTASFTMRVPAENYATFLAKASQAGNMISRNETSDDITDQYVDVESRLKALRAQETRLLEMLETSADLSDLLQVQNQLTNVQAEIESYEGRKRTMDKLTAYSTVEITVYEVKEITEPVKDTYGARVARAFRESWQAAGAFFQGLGLFLIRALPVLLVLGAIVAIVVPLVLRAKKRRAANPRPPRHLPPNAPLAGPAPYAAGSAYPPYPAAPGGQTGGTGTTAAADNPAAGKTDTGDN